MSKNIAQKIKAWAKNPPIKGLVMHSRHMKQLKKKHKPKDAPREKAEPLSVPIGERIKLK